METQRILYPINCRYGPVTRSIDGNYMDINALEMIEMTFNNGESKRVLTRSVVRVPWTPSFFFACRGDCLLSIKRVDSIDVGFGRCTSSILRCGAYVVSSVRSSVLKRI